MTAAHMEGGTLKIHHERRFVDGCAGFKGTFRLWAEKDTRSLAQNALLWLYNSIVANELGWTKEEVHEFCKSKLNLVHRSRIDRVTGEIIDESFPGDTHTMPKDAMAEYIDRYVQFWSEQSIVLPDAEERPPNDCSGHSEEERLQAELRAMGE